MTKLTLVNEMKWCSGGAALLAIAVSACELPVEVGEAGTIRVPTVAPSGTLTDEIEDSSSPSEPPADCSAHDAEQRREYDEWLSTGNQWEALAGQTFVGYVVNGPSLTLTIAADQSATLVVDEAIDPPTERMEGYLCHDNFIDSLACPFDALLPGASYPLHGATLQDGRLRSPVQIYSPLDAWCALQVPVQHDDCFHSVASGEEFSVSTDRCTTGSAGTEVDCDWLLLTQTHTCTCTSSECFALIIPDQPGLDARLSDDGRTIEGVILENRIYLERQN